MDDAHLDYWFKLGRNDHYNEIFAPPSTKHPEIRAAYMRGWNSL